MVNLVLQFKGRPVIKQDMQKLAMSDACMKIIMNATKLMLSLPYEHASINVTQSNKGKLVKVIVQATNEADVTETYFDAVLTDNAML